MKHFCFILILISLCFTDKLYAQTSSAKVNRVYIDHTGMNGNGEITIHVDCNIENMLGQEAKVCVFFYQGDTPYKLSKTSRDLEYLISKYCSPDRQVTVQEDVTPMYRNSHFEDIKLSLPSYVLSMAKNDGKYNDVVPQLYRVEVEIYDKQRSTFISPEFSHSFFVSRRVTACPGGLMCGLCSGTGKVGGSIYGVICQMCKGTGICPMCKGTGMVYSTYTGSNKSQLEHNLRQIGGGSVSTPVPQNNYQSGASSGYGTGVSTPSGSSRRVCPGCNGTGKGRRETVYGTDYTGGRTTYHCSECNLTTPHSHRTPMCRVCYGKGYVE